MEYDVVKTGFRAHGRDKSRGSSGGCRGDNRCIGGMTVITGVSTEHGNLSF